MFVNVRRYQELTGPLILSAPTSPFPGRLCLIKQRVHRLYTFIQFALKRKRSCTCANLRLQKCALEHTNPVTSGGLALQKLPTRYKHSVKRKTES